MATSLTHRYIPRVEQTEENLFMEEYYSSTDTKIYMGNVEQTEISYISFSLQEQLKPIYGYGSRTFDDMAIGNRIVTGMFKVPIKNPEAQTPMDAIVERGGSSTIEDYNDNQQELTDAIEWITGQQTHSSDTIIAEDDVTFEYRTKLINLGYDLDYNSSAYILQQQIKKFQSDNGLYADGILTAATKGEIDKALQRSSLEKHLVYRGTKLYLKPTSASGYKEVNTVQIAYILEEYDDGWAYVMLENGDEGFILIK